MCRRGRFGVADRLEGSHASGEGFMMEEGNGANKWDQGRKEKGWGEAERHGAVGRMAGGASGTWGCMKVGRGKWGKG